jgi:hypothetical protein
MTANPSFEPTATGKPASAAQLKRFNVCLLDFLRPLSAVLPFRFGSKADVRGCAYWRTDGHSNPGYRRGRLSEWVKIKMPSGSRSTRCARTAYSIACRRAKNNPAAIVQLLLCAMRAPKADVPENSASTRTVTSTWCHLRAYRSRTRSA